MAVRLTHGQRRTAFLLSVVGNVLPTLILAARHRPDDLHRGAFLVAAVVAIAAPIAVPLFRDRHRRVYRFIAFSGLLGLTGMQAWTGGPLSPFAILLVMPMIWMGLTGSRRDVGLTAALVVACCFVPMAVFGPPAYPREVGPAVALAVVAVSVLLSISTLTGETTRLTRRLRHDATHDPLTDLLNRRGWDDQAEAAMGGAAMGGAAADVPVCVVLLDLDGLKAVNDTMGHDEGDRVLRGTGRRLAAAFGAQAAVARLGGDEFAVLFVGSTAAQVQDEMDRLRLETPDRDAFSAGIAAATPGEQLGDVMRRADLALYEVKRSGRGRAQVADVPVALLVIEPTVR